MSEAGAEFAPWLGVFETLRVIEGRAILAREHEAELRRAATMLGLKVELNWEHALAELTRQSGRWRWVVTRAGTRLFFVPEPPSPSLPVELSISTLRLGSENWDARFKTVSYLTHAQALQVATTPEVVLLNEHGEVASAARANLFWQRGGQLFTPAHEAGCRRGVTRAWVKTRRPVQEGRFALQELLEAEEIFFTNSMKGIVSVQAIEGRSVTSVAVAEGLRNEWETFIQG